MKKLYLLFCFFLFSFCGAQIINFPDANFKAYLLSANTTNNQIAYNTTGNTATAIDTNGNGEIEVSEAQAIMKLNIKNNTLITNISGIENFINIFILDISSLTSLQNFNLNSIPTLKYVSLMNLPQVTSLNFSNSTELQTLKIYSCDAISNFTITSNTLKDLDLRNGGNFGQLDLTNCPILNKIYIESTSISGLNLSNLNLLNYVDIRSNNLLNYLNISGSNNLSFLSVGGNSTLTSLDISNKPGLTSISCPFNPNLQTLTVSNCINLTSLSAHSNNLSNLNLSGLPKLQSLIIADNNLNSLNLSNLPDLIYINCSTNNLTSLDFSSLPLLKNLFCSNNNLTYLDFSNNPIIQNVFCQSNDLLYINSKNGSQIQINITCTDNPTLNFLCCDNEDVAFYNTNYYLTSNNVVINSYCSFTPGGTFYTIQGNTKYDSNGNSCDDLDVKKAFQKFSISGANGTGSLIGDTTGQYSLPVQAGSHTLTPILENPSYFNISPTTFTANFPTQTSPLTQNFCVTANGNHNDLEIVIIPTTAAAPGFNAKYKILYKNKGTTTQSGSLVFNYNDNLMNFSTATVAPGSQSTGTLNWNFTNLLPFETREITATFVLNTPTATPPLNGNDVLNFTSQINGLTDETPADNTFTLNQTVVNSFDPNDKTCLQGTAITQTQVGDYVHYLIRFENTGTANAQNIVVKDEIDVTKFDISSIVALNGSHSFVTRITSPNVVEFIFENIQLPFNDATNDGFVSFKIRTKSTLNTGDSFSNSAKIYFDYNAPIVTNTYTTAVQAQLATVETATENFSIYPNPVKDFLHFKTTEKILKLEIFDVSGRVISSFGIKGNSADLSGLAKGHYLIKVYTKDQVIVKKLIKE